MVRPAVHPTTEELYDSLGDGLVRDDESVQWSLLRFLDPVVTDLGEVRDIVVGTDGLFGWGAQMDPDEVPLERLLWLAQFIGARPDPLALEAAQRSQAKDSQGWKRGTLASIIAAAQATLTGTKRVFVNERYGTAYRIRVAVYTTQAPDPAVTEAVVRAAKPAGLVLVFDAMTVGPWQLIKDNFATWQTVKDNFATWQDVANYIAP